MVPQLCFTSLAQVIEAVGVASIKNMHGRLQAQVSSE